MLAQTGEFLAFDNNQAAAAAADAGHRVEAEQGRRGVDVQAAPGRQVPRRLADDRRRRRLHHPAAVRSQERLQRALDVRRRAQARRRGQGRRQTVAFHLEAPNGNFPYLVSSDNYNAIIVPKGTDFAKWQKTFIGTGPFKLQSYTQNVGANFVANPDYWGGAPHLASTAFTFYTSQQPQILALQGGQVDVIVQFVVQGAQSLLNNSQYKIIKLKSANHRELSMRNDQAPFTDARVRQAIALSLDVPDGAGAADG